MFIQSLSQLLHCEAQLIYLQNVEWLPPRGSFHHALLIFECPTIACMLFKMKEHLLDFSTLFAAKRKLAHF